MSNQKANHIALASEIAQNTIESMRSQGTLTASTTNLNIPALPGGIQTVTVSTYNATLKLTKLSVQVSWLGQRAHRENVILETIVLARAKHVGG